MDLDSSSGRPGKGPPKCSRCDGMHATVSCPHFKEDRPDHIDASLHYGSLPAAVGDDGGDVLVCGARVVRQDADGHCMYHSLAYCLRQIGHLGDALCLRRYLADYMITHPDMLVAGDTIEVWVGHDVGMTLARYCQRMREANERAWGGGVELAVFAATQYVNVHVYERRGKDFLRMACFHSAQPNKGTIHLHYVSAGHYDALDITTARFSTLKAEGCGRAGQSLGRNGGGGKRLPSRRWLGARANKCRASEPRDKPDPNPSSDNYERGYVRNVSSGVTHLVLNGPHTICKLWKCGELGSLVRGAQRLESDADSSTGICPHCCQNRLSDLFDIPDKDRKGKGRSTRKPEVSDKAADANKDGRIAIDSGSDSSDAAEGAADAKDPSGGVHCRWRAKGKSRRLSVGEAGEDERQNEAGRQAGHPDDNLDPSIVALLDARDEDIPAEKLAMVEELRRSLRGRRQVRPYAEAVKYGLNSS